MAQAAKEREKSFSSFNYREACHYLGIEELKRWAFEAEPVPVSDFFRQRLDRLQRFDLDDFEVSKTLLIDAICEEGLEESERLKVWKRGFSSLNSFLLIALSSSPYIPKLRPLPARAECNRCVNHNQPIHSHHQSRTAIISAEETFS